MNEPARALAEIRAMMERSSKFLSLSGLAGISAGVVALLGAGAAYWDMSAYSAGTDAEFLFLDACAVLSLAIGSAVFFTRRMARKQGVPAWSNTTKFILTGLLVPLCAGGVLCLLFWWNGFSILIPGAMLMFYGMALINTSKYTAPEVLYFGVLQTVLGLFAVASPINWIVFWAFGFGAAHIVYGTVVFSKYEK